jgi:hypothetical protein
MWLAKSAFFLIKNEKNTYIGTKNKRLKWEKKKEIKNQSFTINK